MVVVVVVVVVGLSSPFSESSSEGTNGTHVAKALRTQVRHVEIDKVLVINQTIVLK